MATNAQNGGQDGGAAEAQAGTDGFEMDADMLADVSGRLGISGVFNPEEETGTGDGDGAADDGANGDGAAGVDGDGTAGTDDDDGGADGGAAGGDEAGQAAGTEDEDGTGDGDGAGGDDDAGQDAGDSEIAKLKLPAEVQAAVNKRINTLNRERREAQESAAAMQDDLTRLQEQLAQSNQLLAEAQAGALSDQTGLHPLLLAKNAAELDAREMEILKFRRFARQNPNGGTYNEQELDAGDVQDRLGEMEDELLMVLPKARELVKQRTKLDAAAQKIYPTLFDAQNPDAVTYRNVLNRLPGLQALPGAAVIVGDMIAGERLRLKQARAGGNDAGAGKPPASPSAPPARPAPKVPVTPSGGGSAPPNRNTSQKKSSRVDIQKFQQAGADRDALAGAVEGLLGDDDW